MVFVSQNWGWKDDAAVNMGILFRTFTESYFKVILTDKNIGITFYLIMVVFEIITLFWVWMNMNIVVELRKRHFIGISIKALRGIWLLCVKDCYCFCFYFIVNDCYRKCCLKYHIRLFFVNCFFYFELRMFERFQKVT